MAWKLNINRITKPSGIAFFAVTLSFCAWLCPDFGVLRKGFDVAEQPSLFSSFILFSWYLLIFTSFVLGQRLGAALAKSRRKAINLPRLDSRPIYLAFTILAAIGTVATLFRIFRTLPLLEAAIYIYLGQANRLKNTLYDDYSAGILSLRYLVLFSASLAIYRTVKFRKVSLLAIANIVLLGATVLISSRLILIATLVVSAFLITYGKRHIRISPVKLGICAACLFFILSVLNSSRNSNFYTEHNQTFGEAGISEIITYLGSPFNVALGAASRTDEITSGRTDLYREYIDIEPLLTTNSAFVQLHETMGYIAWPYVGIVCCFMGFMFSWLSSFGRTSLLLPSGAILYGSAELWRIDLFRQGIFIVWIVAGIGVPVVLFLIDKRRLNRSSPARRERILGNSDLPDPLM
jgi:hypothetical protein